MVATAPTKSVAPIRIPRGSHAPDLAHFRQRYPETVASLGALPRREEWLRRVWELETRSQGLWDSRGGGSSAAEFYRRRVRRDLRGRGDGDSARGCARARARPSRAGLRLRRQRGRQLEP